MSNEKTIERPQIPSRVEPVVSDDDMPNEKEALACGLAIVTGYDAQGDSDFDKGIRLLQEKLGIRANP